jgi:protein TonB
MKKHPYAKAIGISLVFHAMLFGLLIIGYNRITPVSVAAPIEVEFVPASVVNTGDTQTEVSSSSPTAELQSEQQTIQVEQEVIPQKTTQQVQADGKTEIQTSFSGSATVGIPSASINNDGAPKGNRQDSPVVRTQASYISGARPSYPRDARQAGWEGAVVIRVLVATDGSASTVAVHASSGYASLDEAAAQAIKQWHFAPACHGATAVESYYDVRVKFRLADWQ